MSEATSAPTYPVFNHIAISVPSEMISGQSGEDLRRFYGEVFGWAPMPTMTEEGRLLVLRAHSNEQFVYLHAADEPMTCPIGDHFGMSVTTPTALDDILDRARKYQESDPRVEISDRNEEDFKAVILHSVYIRFLLPLQIEIQCFDWQGAAGPQSLPKS